MNLTSSGEYDNHGTTGVDVPMYYVESEEDLLAQVMAAADVGLPGIGDRVYQNMVRTYCVCVEVTGRHIECFL